MKSYRVRMTEGVEVRVRPMDPAEDLYALVDYALEANRFIYVHEVGPGDNDLSINPRHVLYVREVAE